VFETVAPPPEPRPGTLRRLAAGAWHPPAAAWYLLVRPRLWLRAALPAVVAVACMVGGMAIAVLLAQRVQDSLTVPRSWGPLLAAMASVATFTWALFLGLVAGLAIALLVASPLLELLQRRVEVLETGRSPDAGRGLAWDLLQSLRGAVFFGLAAPVVFAIGLIPVAGPPLATLWAAAALSFQQTDSPLARRGRDFAGRRRWHREWRPESLGFGLAGLLTLLVPGLNLIAVPSLAIGAARLVMELESLDPAADTRPEETATSAEAPPSSEGDAAPESAAAAKGTEEPTAE